jgi:hypothetical protein
MAFMPDGVHRRADDDGKPPTWYVIWLGRPGADGSVIIGRSRRLRRHRWHRFFSEVPGVQFREIEGHVAGMEWLLEVHRQHQRPAGVPSVPLAEVWPRAEAG